MSKETDILASLKRSSAETKAFLTDKDPSERERTTVAAFLRMLGISFQQSELVKKGPEPIDVWFKEARFQVTEIVDPGRKRNDEVKTRDRKIQNANSLKDLLEPIYFLNSPLQPSELLEQVIKRLNEKANRSCKEVDLLIYVNLLKRHMMPGQRFAQLPEAMCSRWRSISVVMERFAVVLWAEPTAPNFLIEHQGQSFWDRGPESNFPRLGSSR